MVSSELLLSNDLPQGNVLRHMMDNERRKKDFFMKCADGIQFEYDKLRHKVTYVNMYENDMNKRTLIFHSKESEGNILPAPCWEALRAKLMCTTRDDPVTKMNVMLRIDGEYLPYTATVMALWPEHGNEYISVLGRFAKIENP